MTSLMVMATGWQRHLRALFRVLATSLALMVTLGVAYERPEVVVILGPPPMASGVVQSTPASGPLVPRTQTPRRHLASTRVSAPRSANNALQLDRLARLAPPDLHPHRPGPPLYLAHLRILC